MKKGNLLHWVILIVTPMVLILATIFLITSIHYHKEAPGPIPAVQHPKAIAMPSPVVPHYHTQHAGKIETPDGVYQINDM